MPETWGTVHIYQLKQQLSREDHSRLHDTHTLGSEGLLSMSDMMLLGINTGCCRSGLSFSVEVSGAGQEESK